MLDHTLDAENSICSSGQGLLYRKPILCSSQRRSIRTLATRGAFGGIIMEAPEFPGWESIGAMAAHFRFVRDHHKQIRRVALVTASPLGTVAENLASHFVSAEIKRFGSGDLKAAEQWVSTRL